MTQVSLAEAKAKLSALVEQVLDGEEVEITRRGKPVVRLIASRTARPAIDIEAMRRLTEHQRLEGRTEQDPQAFWDEMRGRNRD